MQIMGAVARELGFKAPYLSALFDPTENLQWGCMKLGQLTSRYTGGAISAYNAGSPQPGSEYETSVLKWVERLRPLFV
jgi:soluble lytic murein transglycosylase-like protein